MCVASCDDKVVILEVNSTEGLFGHRVVPSCPLPVMKIKCERFIFIFFCHYWKRHLKQQRFLNFFYFRFQTKTCPFGPLDVFKVSRIVLSDLWEGGRGIVASSDMKPGDSLLRVVTESSDRKGSKLSPASPSDKVAAPELSERNAFQ